MKKLVLKLVGVLLLFSMPLTSQASNKSSLNNIFDMVEMTIQVLPEYAHYYEDEEKSGTPILFGYHGTLINTSKEPQSGIIEIPLPMDSENFQIGYVADYNREFNERFEVDYEVDSEKGVISWETTETVQPEEHYKFVIEFYTSGVQVDGKNKSFSYTFENFTKTEMLNLYIVEPLKTEKIDLSPEPEAHHQNNFGLNMFYYQLKDLDVNEKFTIDVNYERPEQLLTTELFEKMHVNQVTEPEVKQYSPIVIVGLIVGVSIIGIALLVYFLKRKSNKQTSQSNKAKSKSKNKRNEQQDQLDDAKIARLRAMLVEGKITQEEYEEVLKKLGGGV